MLRISKALILKLSAASLIVVALLLAYFFPNAKFWWEEMQKDQEAVYYTPTSKQDLHSIKVKVVYVSPADRISKIPSEWQGQVEDALREMKAFWEHQLGSGVNINFEIYKRPLYGRKTSEEYSKGNTNAGNPNALLALKKEIEDRIFTAGGDGYDAAFIKTQDTDFSVIGIVYEDVGASATLFTENQVTSGQHVVPVKEGEHPAFLVSRYFFEGANYKDYGSTILAHEFGHTLGLPDAYDPRTGDALGSDIMGTGRFRPIRYTYLSAEHKKLLGFQ